MEALLGTHELLVGVFQQFSVWVLTLCLVALVQQVPFGKDIGHHVQNWNCGPNGRTKVANIRRLGEGRSHLHTFTLQMWVL